MKFYTLLLIIFYGFNNNFKSNTIHIFKKSLNRTSRVKIFYKWINKTDEQKIKESWLKKDINKKLTYLDFLDSSFYLKTFFLMFINSYFLIYIMFNKEVKNLMKNLCNRLGYLILNNINIKDDSDAKNIITEVIDSIYIIIIIYIIEKIAQFFFIINLKKIKKFSKKKIIFFLKKAKNYNNFNKYFYENFLKLEQKINKFLLKIMELSLSSMGILIWILNTFSLANKFTKKEINFSIETLFILICFVIINFCITLLNIYSKKFLLKKDNKYKLLIANKKFLLLNSMEYFFVNNNYKMLNKFFKLEEFRTNIQKKIISIEKVFTFVIETFNLSFSYIIFPILYYFILKKKSDKIKKLTNAEAIKIFKNETTKITVNNAQTATSQLLIFFSQNIINFFPIISRFSQSSFVLINKTKELNKLLSKFNFKPIKTEKPNSDIYKNKIIFKNVTVKKPGSIDDILKIDNLIIDNKKTIAIVGASGSGKSTFINLLIKKEQDYEGDIFFENHKQELINLRNIHMANIANNFAILPQETVIFSDSIIDNITMGLPTDKEILDKIFQDNRLDFLKKKNKKGETKINQKKLSGGEIQRIMIYRMIYKYLYYKKHKNVIFNIILDEMDKGLDPLVNKYNFDEIQKQFSNERIFFITHNILNSFFAEEVIVFHNGQLVGQGSAQQLLKENTYFQNLFYAQMGGFYQIEKKLINKE